MVLEASMELTVKAGGSWIKIDPSGIRMGGRKVNLGGGGSPGNGSGVSPELPDGSNGVEVAGKPAQMNQQYENMVVLSTTTTDETNVESVPDMDIMGKGSWWEENYNINCSDGTSKDGRSMEEAYENGKLLTEMAKKKNPPEYAKKWYKNILDTIYQNDKKTFNSYFDKITRANSITNEYSSMYDRHNLWLSPSGFLNATPETGRDCEDYALYKYALLRQAGIEKENMSIAIVKNNNEIHVVLVVRDPDTGKFYVLDNLSGNIKSYNKNYKYLYRVQEDKICGTHKK
jgi:predicted transglutaminase-like cysteine proteinase